ncbi:MAG: DUF5996 family protein [Bacteriovoracaceae bacterium]
MKKAWPKLEYNEWRPTYETLHRWVQIVGKLKLCKSPWLNHSWGSTLLVNARGLTTSAIPLGDRILTIDFDFVDHQLLFEDSEGTNFVLLLQSETVASFFERFKEALKIFDVTPTFYEGPNEVMDFIPFAEDTNHATYNPVHAHNFFQALVRVSNLLQEFRAEFIGKSSPVHFFWGSFDLAVTRFSGHTAPEHPGGVPHLPDLVAREAYSHEVMSCGFWPGNEMYPKAAFYAYAYPEPKGFAQFRMPKNAFYHQALHELILDYDAVRAADDPEELVRDFIHSAYLAAADLGNWDRESLEHSRYLDEVRETYFT